MGEAGAVERGVTCCVYAAAAAPTGTPRQVWGRGGWTQHVAPRGGGTAAVAPPVPRGADTRKRWGGCHGLPRDYLISWEGGAVGEWGGSEGKKDWKWMGMGVREKIEIRGRRQTGPERRRKLY